MSGRGGREERCEKKRFLGWIVEGRRREMGRIMVQWDDFINVNDDGIVWESLGKIRGK